MKRHYINLNGFITAQYIIHKNQHTVQLLRPSKNYFELILIS